MIRPHVKMIVLVGASASGKTEVARRLVIDYGFKKIVTTTTRDPRESERDGVDYHFVAKNSFDEMRERSAFVEVTNYGDHFYGIQKKDIDRHGVVIVDPNGANALVKALNKDVFVVLVETDETIRKNRMLRRGDSTKATLKRLQFDRRHFQKETFIRTDYVVYNDQRSLEDLTGEIHEVYLKYLLQEDLLVY